MSAVAETVRSTAEVALLVVDDSSFNRILLRRRLAGVDAIGPQPPHHRARGLQHRRPHQAISIR